MLPWVVNSGSHSRQASRHALLFAKSCFLSPLPSNPSALFQVPYPASPLLATLTKTAELYTNSSQFGTRSSLLHLRLVFFLPGFLERSTFQPSNIPPCLNLSPFLSHSCALFCAFLHSGKTQVPSFHAIPYSLPKTTRGGGTPPLQEGQTQAKNCPSCRSRRPRLRSSGGCSSMQSSMSRAPLEFGE